MSNDDRRPIVVLGAGITGLTAAWKLAQAPGSRVILLEKETITGGLAATLRVGAHGVDIGSHQLDVGSHRIHEKYDPAVFRLVQELLGADLLKRPRRGLILIRGRFLRYPPSVPQILSAYGLRSSGAFARDYASAALVRLCLGPRRDNFREYTVRCVGKSLYESFYKPYAEKLWGVPPEEISHEPAMNRVKKFEMRALFRELRARLGRREPHSFYYPARGIGQISEKIRERFVACGGRLVTGAQLEDIAVRDDRRVTAVRFRSPDGSVETVSPKWVVATAPIDVLHRMIRLEADGGVVPPFDLSWRSLRILYLVTRDRIPAPNETYYIPEPPYLIGRVSELGKYSPLLAPPGDETILTVEVPCTEGDDAWSMPEERLRALCVAELQRLGVLADPLRHPVGSLERRVRNLYPVHRIGWRKSFDRIYGRLDRIENLFLIGRPALFLHCNIDHCVLMALKLSEFLLSGRLDKRQWREISEEFFRFQVRD